MACASFISHLAPESNSEIRTVSSVWGPDDAALVIQIIRIPCKMARVYVGLCMYVCMDCTLCRPHLNFQNPTYLGIRSYDGYNLRPISPFHGMPVERPTAKTKPRFTEGEKKREKGRYILHKEYSVRNAEYPYSTVLFACMQVHLE